VASVGGSGRRAADTARRAADSRWIERTARVGLAARGLVYVLIDILAFRIAFVDRAERADQKGAFQTLAQTASARPSLDRRHRLYWLWRLAGDRSRMGPPAGAG
jgi:Domain of Unknown Function (DUF1206)